MSYVPPTLAALLFTAAAQHLELRKSVASDFSNVTPESLGPVSHLATWDSQQEDFGTTVKLIPVVSARQLQHSETATTAHQGGSGRLGFTPETGVAPARSRTSVKITGWLKGLAELSKTSAHAGYSVLVPDAMANATAQQQEDYSALQRLAHNRATLAIHYDTTWESDDADEEALLGSAGLFQQIRDNTADINPNGVDNTNIIDLEGEMLDADRLRLEITNLKQITGAWPTVITVSGPVLTAISAQLMPQMRADFSTSGLAYGTNVVAINVNGKMIPILPDYHLGWEATWPLYQEPDAAISPPSAPTSVTAVAGAVSGSEVSNFDADSDGNVFYVVVPVSRTGVYGYGTRSPVSTSSYTAVAVGEKVTLTITPSSGSELMFAVFRGHEDTGGAKTDAALIGYVPANGGAPVTFTDLNARRPRTDRALALPLGGPIMGSLMPLLQAGGMDGLNRAVAAGYAQYSEDAQLMAGPPMARGICRAVLGPSMIRIKQGTLGWMQQADMIGQITRTYAPGARNALAFDNVGRS